MNGAQAEELAVTHRSAGRRRVSGAPEGRSRASERSLACHWLGRVGFRDGLALQEELVREHERIGDTLLLLEHDDVYTTGRGGRAEHLPGAHCSSRFAIPVHRIGRGGDATYHGPGQLVGYPLIDLRRRGSDVHRYLRCLEGAMLGILRDLGVRAELWPGRTGAWVAGPRGGRPYGGPGGDDREVLGARKIASIGIGVRRGISLHGFALNIAVDLTKFSAIVPCGLPGVRMTSVEREGGRTPCLSEVGRIAAGRVRWALARDALLHQEVHS
jgi:lipoate-protein ligase B